MYISCCGVLGGKKRIERETNDKNKFFIARRFPYIQANIVFPKGCVLWGITVMGEGLITIQNVL
jgi:hypothetical protein